MNNKTKFTEKQLLNYRKYEKVRKSGRFNMFDPKARQTTGLETDEYLFVMNNFSQLRESNDVKVLKK